jgi:glycerol-3-phosphate acyltransferase PlsY
MLLVTGIVSVSSMSAGVAFPILLFLLFDTPSVIFKLFSIFIAIALLITHKKNIRRIIRGEESKLIKFGRKKEKSD